MEPQKEEKLEQLERVLRSRALQGSENLKAFLQFVVLKHLDHQEGNLKEYTIATEVFGRDSSYDPRTDAVVRVQAGRLRTKLQEYYATDGKDDQVVIDLPKGRYAPVFAYANGQKRLVDPESQLLIRWWDGFARSSESVLIAYSNPIFQGTAETGMKVLHPLDAPGQSFSSSFSLPTAVSQPQSGLVITEHYTGVGELMGVYLLGNLFWRIGQPFRVKRSLLLTWDDLKAENTIILGSPAENVLLRELPQEQDFVFRLFKDADQNERYGIINLKPQPGEQEVYLSQQEGLSSKQVVEDYAVVSLLRGLDSQHKLLMLAGIKTFGTQAAVEYVTKPEYINDLVAHLSGNPLGSLATLPAYYQVLLRVKVKDAVPVQVSYVTHHVLT